jgi:hypothetical protein
VCVFAVAESPRPRPPGPWLASAHTHDRLASNKIGAAGARDMGAALQVNTTLTELE